MARPRTPQSLKQRLFANNVIKPVIYCEGPHEYSYLSKLVELHVIKDYQQGIKLQATAIKLRINAIKRDLNNESIEQIMWIVDGGDVHIKNSKEFKNFYAQWLSKRENEWSKLHILINSPCLEYWFLLHHIDSPTDDKNCVTCFADATSLENSKEFKQYCPRGKGAELVKLTAKNVSGRKKAIKRAKKLLSLLTDLHEKNRFVVARAEIFYLFDEASKAYIGLPVTVSKLT